MLSAMGLLESCGRGEVHCDYAVLVGLRRWLERAKVVVLFALVRLLHLASWSGVRCRPRSSSTLNTHCCCSLLRLWASGGRRNVGLVGLLRLAVSGWRARRSLTPAPPSKIAMLVDDGRLSQAISRKDLFRGRSLSAVRRFVHHC